MQHCELEGLEKQYIHFNFGISLDDTGLVQLIEYPTSKDNVIQNCQTHFHELKSCQEYQSDHNIVFMEFKVTPCNSYQTGKNNGKNSVKLDRSESPYNKQHTFPKFGSVKFY